jgi:glycosyltransferase involved in cell wall biosynthesis
MRQGREKLLILVVAYEAETTLTSVLERIPAAVRRELEVEILVIDDASTDRTFEIGRQYQAAHPKIPLKVLRNQYNQGYGGNQKIGYEYAVAEGFAYVALIHGDGQYAPEELPRLLAPFREERADAVFGSRMLTPWTALRGGMPLYKFVGNRVLTTAQNLLLRTHLSEFHSGYRIYSVKALAGIPFQLNANDFHFDTEIIIQLVNAGRRIVELPIPTYYGREICRVNGIGYAKNVILASLRNVAHKAGILYQRRFDTAVDANVHYGLKLGYPSSHTWALDAVPNGAAVIDIGSGPGGLAAELLKKGCKVAVVDRLAPAKQHKDIAVRVQDLDHELDFDIRPYDHILLLDIIEHLKNPEKFFERLRQKFDYEPRTLIITTPNIAFVVQRLMLLLGQFNYGYAGVLDRTHTRLYTFRTARKLLKDAGLKVVAVRGVPAPFPKVLGDGLIGRAAVAVNLALIRLSKTLFSYQIYLEAESTPDVRYLLEDAKAVSAAAGSSPLGRRTRRRR